MKRTPACTRLVCRPECEWKRGKHNAATTLALTQAGLLMEAIASLARFAELDSRTMAEYAKTCALCGSSYVAKQRTALYCQRRECVNERARLEAAAYRARTPGEVLRARQRERYHSNPDRQRGYQQRYVQQKDHRCADCGRLIQPARQRCMICYLAKVRSFAARDVPCRWCGRTFTIRVGRNPRLFSCLDCQGIVARTAALLGVSSRKVHYLVDRDFRPAVGSMTRLEALESALQDFGHTLTEIGLTPVAIKH